MAERDLKIVSVKQSGPELRHLLALGDRVRRNESNPSALSPEVGARLQEPSGNIVET